MVTKIVISFILIVIVFYIITTPGKFEVIKNRFKTVAKIYAPVIKEKIKNWFARRKDNRF